MGPQHLAQSAEGSRAGGMQKKRRLNQRSFTARAQVACVIDRSSHMSNAAVRYDVGQPASAERSERRARHGPVDLRFRIEIEVRRGGLRGPFDVPGDFDSGRSRSRILEVYDQVAAGRTIERWSLEMCRFDAELVTS